MCFYVHVLRTSWRLAREPCAVFLRLGGLAQYSFSCAETLRSGSSKCHSNSSDSSTSPAGAGQRQERAAAPCAPRQPRSSPARWTVLSTAPSAARGQPGAALPAQHSCLGKLDLKGNTSKHPFCGWNFGAVRFYMISESIAVGSVNGNSLGKKQGESKRRNEASVLLRACKQA